MTIQVCWAWISTDLEEQAPTQVLRWLDIDNTDEAKTNEFLFFYLHVSLWVWSNITGWGGNWSPHSPITTGWTYLNQFVGVFLYMYLFGEIVNILQNFDLASAEFNAIRDKINKFMQIREIPAEMQLRVHLYLDEVWYYMHADCQTHNLTCICICMHAYKHIWLHAYTFAHIYIRTYMYAYIRTYGKSSFCVKSHLKRDPRSWKVSCFDEARTNVWPYVGRSISLNCGPQTLKHGTFHTYGLIFKWPHK